MIYKKPKWEASVIPVVPNAVVSFFHSLPAEFEIVEPGMTQVRWPDGLTRDGLYEVARSGSWCQCADAIFRLAEILPEEKKKRKVELWRHQDSAVIHIFAEGCNPNVSEPPHLWRKVGECEVDE